MKQYEGGEANGNNTNYNDNEINEIENQSLNQSDGFLRGSPNAADACEVFRQILKDNIDYEGVFRYDDRKKNVDEILELMLEVICTAKKYLSVNSERVPAELVKGRLLKLDFTYIVFYKKEM